jgi:hypothetical protein
LADNARWTREDVVSCAQRQHGVDTTRHHLKEFADPLTGSEQPVCVTTELTVTLRSCLGSRASLVSPPAWHSSCSSGIGNTNGSPKPPAQPSPWCPWLVRPSSGHGALPGASLPPPPARRLTTGIRTCSRSALAAALAALCPAADAAGDSCLLLQRVAARFVYTAD